MEPYEIVAAPYQMWVAPTGTTFPKVDDLESAFGVSWVLLGTSGDRSYTDTGVQLNRQETTQDFTPAGSTLPIKKWTTAEAVTVAVTLADLTVEQFALIIDDAAVTTVAAGVGVAGEKSFSLIHGVQKHEYALLVRGISPYGETFNAQYEFPRVCQDGNQQPTYSKQNPAELLAQFTVMDTIDATDPALYRAQNAAAS